MKGTKYEYRLAAWLLISISIPIIGAGTIEDVWFVVTIGVLVFIAGALLHTLAVTRPEDKNS